MKGKMSKNAPTTPGGASLDNLLQVILKYKTGLSSKQHLN